MCKLCKKAAKLLDGIALEEEDYFTGAELIELLGIHKLYCAVDEWYYARYKELYGASDPKTLSVKKVLDSDMNTLRFIQALILQLNHVQPLNVTPAELKVALQNLTKLEDEAFQRLGMQKSPETAKVSYAEEMN